MEEFGTVRAFKDALPNARETTGFKAGRGRVEDFSVQNISSFLLVTVFVDFLLFFSSFVPSYSTRIHCILSCSSGGTTPEKSRNSTINIVRFS
jgi:hypothetical protein